MRSIFSAFLFGIAVGAAGMYTSQTYHVVRANDGFHFVPKMSTDFADTYVDIRSFTLRDWEQHRTLAVALTKANKTHLLDDSAGDQIRQAAQGVLNALGVTGQ
jgi:hypothetical protein